jgi:hypothetical protein
MDAIELHGKILGEKIRGGSVIGQYAADATCRHGHDVGPRFDPDASDRARCAPRQARCKLLVEDGAQLRNQPCQYGPATKTHFPASHLERKFATL